jgi:hypothetical protein
VRQGSFYDNVPETFDASEERRSFERRLSPDGGIVLETKMEKVVTHVETRTTHTVSQSAAIRPGPNHVTYVTVDDGGAIVDHRRKSPSNTVGVGAAQLRTHSPKQTIV